MARKQHHEEHENHERWLVSYADFITLLFAFFVVMYAISSVNEGKYRVLSDSLVNAFRSTVNVSGATVVAPPNAAGSPITMVINKPKADPKVEAARTEHRLKMRSMAEEIRRVLAPLVSGGQVRVTEGAHGISVEINASVLFAPGEALLGIEAARALRAVAQVVSAGDFPITIEGHTDNLPISTPNFPSNWELSAVRASSVVRLFIENKVAAYRMTAAGYGDQRPVADNSTADGRARNRRVTILIESMLPADSDAGSAPATTDEDGFGRGNKADGALGVPKDEAAPAAPAAGAP